MFFEGKCRELDRVVVSEPGRVDGERFELRGIGGRDWKVSGILKDFTELADKSFLDDFDDDEEFDPQEMIEYMNEVCEAVEEMDDDEFQETFGDFEDEECNAENHFGLVRGVKFIVGLMDPGVSVKLRFERDYDAAFDVLPCEYGDAADEVLVYTIRSESGCLGLGVDGSRAAMRHEVTQGLGARDLGSSPRQEPEQRSGCAPKQACGPSGKVSPDGDDLKSVSGCLPTYEDGDCGEVFVGIYGGKVRFVIISGTVVDYETGAQETVYRYLVDALKIEVFTKVAFDELALMEMKLGLWGDVYRDEESQSESVN